MKTFRLIGMALLAVVMCVNFVSCSSDDDEEEISASLEGTWYYDYGEGWELYNGNKEPWSTDPDPYNPNDRDASTKMEIKKVGENQYSISTYYYDNGAWQYSESETITLNGKSFKYDGENCTILTLTSKTLIYEVVEPNGKYYDKYTYIKM